MPITSVKGKACTLTIGALSAEGWVTNLDTAGDKALQVETVETWGESVVYSTDATANYTATLQFLFDPLSSSLGSVIEAAFIAGTATTLTVAFGAASRVYTDWTITSYSDAAAADGLVTVSAGLTGETAWATTYDTP